MKKLTIIIISFVFSLNGFSQSRTIEIGDTVTDFIESYNANANALMGAGDDIKPAWQLYNDWNTGHRLSVAMSYGADDFTFCMSPDVHSYYDGLDRINSFIGMNGVFDTIVQFQMVAGDFIQEATTWYKEYYYEQFSDGYGSRFGTFYTPLLVCLGNHDGLSFFHNHVDTTLSKQDQRDYILDTLYAKEPSIDFIKNDDDDLDACYYFTDFSYKKMRVIALDVYDTPQTIQADTFKYRQQDIKGISGDQLQWLVDTALVVPDSNWHVIIINHERIEYEVTFDSSFINLYNILLAFKENGGDTIISTSDNAYNIEFDFSETNGFEGSLVGIFHGHTHSTDQITYQGIHIIAAPSTVPSHGGNSRHKSTSTEDAADFVIVKKDQRLFYIIRYGAGGRQDQESMDDINGDRGLDGEYTY